MPDSALDALPDAPGLRAVRAKVHAEASSMCPTCGRRHLLDSHCSAAPEVVHDVDPPPVETAPEPDALEDATTPTRSDTAREGDNGSARSRLRSVVAYLGLDAASFGDVGDDAPGAAASSEVSRWAWSEPEDAAPATADPPYPRLKRAAAFLGFDLGADDRARATELGQPPAAPSSTTSIDSADEGDEGEDDEDALVPDLPIPMTAPSIDADDEEADDEETDDEETDDEETDRVTSPDDAPRKYWRRTDDDILYRPSRRPRSPRRAWRDRIASRR